MTEAERTSNPLGVEPPAADRPLPAPALAPGTRVGRPEREVTDARLRAALAEDRLTIDEYSDRLSAVLAAKTQSDLDRVVADLPEPTVPGGGPGPPAASAAPVKPKRRWFLAVMGGHEQTGRWRPAEVTTALAVMGGVKIDLRHAEVPDGEVVLEVVAVMGGVEIVVPEGVDVELSGLAFMGAREVKVGDPAAPGAPLLHLRAYAFMGGVEVRTANKRERAAEARSGSEPATPGWGTPPSDPEVRGRRDARLRRRRWGWRLAGVALAAALLAGPLGNLPRAVVGNDAVAVFGGTDYTPTEAELAGEDPVEVFSMFGGVNVVIPESHRARNDVTAIFGGTDCDACKHQSERVVDVEGFTMFGGIDIEGPNARDDDDD